jgi:hypothetical protein
MFFNVIDRSIFIQENTNLERKDSFANIDFIDENGNHYAFDGKGNLSVGGTLSVNNETNYVYLYDGETYLVYESLDSEAIGSIAFTDNYVSLIINDTQSKLYIANDLMGEWAIGGEFALFTIGATDTDGVIRGNYRGHDVTLTYLDNAFLYFSFKEHSGLPITYYVFVVDDEKTGEKILALSEYTNLLGEYIICSRANTLMGTWTRADGTTITFDGVSSSYQNGVAMLNKPFTASTPYYYTIKEEGILMWSQDLLQGRTKYFRLDETDDLTNPSAFVKDGKAFIRTEVDG